MGGTFNLFTQQVTRDDRTASMMAPDALAQCRQIGREAMITGFNGTGSGVFFHCTVYFRV
jgi:hypothetical protein